MPISGFVSVEARPNTTALIRRDAQFFHEINGINKPNFNLNTEIEKIQNWMDDTGFVEAGMEVKFGGLTQRGDEATSFLIQAFIGALFLMFIIFEPSSKAFFVQEPVVT